MMNQALTIRTWQPIALDIDTEFQVCERVAHLELSPDPVDHLAASILRQHFDLDGVWIEEVKEQASR